MTINFSWELNDDEAALFQQFVATEGNPLDTPETYANRVGLKALRGHLERSRLARDEANQKTITAAVVENLQDEGKRGEVLEVLGLKESGGGLVKKTESVEGESKS